MPTNLHPPDLDERLRAAVRHFWSTRDTQAKKKGKKKDQGTRGSVTGGAQMDGFIEIVGDLLLDAGLPEASLFVGSKLEIPGYFRPEKRWDLLVVHKGILVAAVEFKSQTGSFGNNSNNRIEEAIGNAADARTAFREGAFKPSPRPWTGFFVLLEDAEKSTRPVRVKEPHFPVFEDLRNLSYAGRYDQLCLRLVREGLYDSTALLLAPAQRPGDYREPNQELAFRALAASIVGRVSATLSLEQ